MVGALALIVAGFGLVRITNAPRVRQQMTVAVAQDEQAGPLPLLSLRPAAEAPTVRTIESRADQLVRAEVSRQYIAPDGASFTFELDQFYRYDTAWRRVEPPADYWGAAKTRAGRYTLLSYRARDAAFAENELGPALDQMLAGACAAWACPADFSLQVWLTSNPLDPPDSAAAPPPPSDDPLAFALLPLNPRDWAIIYQPLRLTSPHLAGYPTEPHSLALLKQALASRVLREAALELVQGSQSQPAWGENPFWLALVARMGARLGLESPDVMQLQPPPGSLDLEALWNLGLNAEPASPDAARVAARAALGVLNRLLAVERGEAEYRLFRALASAEGASLRTWVAAGLDVPGHEAVNRLLAIARPAGAASGLALSCVNGPALLALPNGQMQSLLGLRLASSLPLAWSPDGRRLALVAGGLLAVMDYADSQMQWLPGELLRGGAPDKLTWVSPTVVAYIVPVGEGGSPEEFALRFHDTRTPTRQLKEVPGVFDYVLSPDRALAAVGQRQQSSLGIMPALGGAIVNVDDGGSPAWSPDGQSIVYTHYGPEQNRYSLRLYGVPAGPGQAPTISELADEHFTGPLTLSAAFNLSRQLAQAGPDAPIEILSSAEADDGIAPYDLVGRWSPVAGNQIAFALIGENRSRVGIIELDAAGARIGWSPILDSDGPVSKLDFSADGEFVAFSFAPPGKTPRLVVYDLARKTSLDLEGGQVWAWSPAGHQLAWASSQALHLMADPRQPVQQQLAAMRCLDIVWNPIH